MFTVRIKNTIEVKFCLDDTCHLIVVTFHTESSLLMEMKVQSEGKKESEMNS